VIAKTVIGNNAVGLGLITHFTAVIIAMVPFAQSDTFITGIYVSGSLLLSLGIFVELFDTQENVLKNWHFYAASALSLLAFIGPLFSCWILYLLSKEEKKTAGGFIASVFALQVHPIVLLIWSIAIGIALALLFQQHDPYFSH
jgi:hypothetical protein